MPAVLGHLIVVAALGRAKPVFVAVGCWQCLPISFCPGIAYHDLWPYYFSTFFSDFLFFFLLLVGSLPSLSVVVVFDSGGPAFLNAYFVIVAAVVCCPRLTFLADPFAYAPS